MSGLGVRGLTVRYGSFVAVREVSLDIPAGTVLGLVGESGSGKSTLARAVVGLTAYDGDVTVGGVDLRAVDRRRAAEARRRVQMVFQDPRSSLDPRFTVGQCIGEALLRERGWRPASRPAHVRELLELVALDPALAPVLPHRLSGGQRQRVAIARALAAEPDVLIADEVTASLDVSVQAVILNLLQRIQRELGLTMLFISHNLAVVRYLSDHLGVMYAGELVEYGPAAEVIAASQHPYTRSLLEAVPQVGRGRLAPERPPA
jgi:peptide/nickel transport system ATP-binding protein